MLLVLAPLAVSQSRPLAFDRVTIEPSKLTPQQRQWQVGSYHVNIIGQPLRAMIESAYHLTPNRLVAPDWMETAAFDLIGTIPDGTQAQVPEMMQTILEDRFRMKMHREMRPQPAYVLVVDEGGPKLTPVQERKDTVTDPVTGESEMTGTLFALAQSAIGPLDRPVIDRTGSKELYRTRLNMTSFFLIEPRRPSSARVPSDAEKLTQSNERLRKLGLRLIPGESPLEVLVIDSALQTPGNPEIVGQAAQPAADCPIRQLKQSPSSL